MTLKRPELDKPKSFSGGRDALDVGGSDALLDSEYFEAAAAPSISPAPAALVFAGLAPTVSGQDLPVLFISDEVVTSSSDSGSTTITVPADCDCVVIIATGWTGAARVLMPMTTASIGGANSTSAQSSNDNSFEKLDLRYLVSPATGAQTFAWDFGGTGAIDEGANFIIAYFKNVDAAAPVLDSDKSTGAGTITMTGGGALDLMVGGSSTFDTIPTVTGDGQTSLTAPARFNNAYARGAYELGALTYVVSGGGAELCSAALILKAAPGAGSSGVTVSPANAALAITEQAPGVAFGAATAPNADTLAIVEQAATVVVSVSSAPAPDSLALAGQSATLSASSSSAPAPDTLAIAGQAPAIAASALVSPPIDTTTIAGQAATVAASSSAAPDPDALAFTGYAPTIGASGNATAAPGLDALAFTGQGPSVAASASSSPSSSALAITERAPVVSASVARAPAPDTLATQGYAPSLTIGAGASSSPANDNLALSGFAAAIAASALIAVGFQALTVSSAAASVSVSSTVSPAPDAVAIAEQAPGVLVTITPAPASAVLAIAAHAPTVTRVSSISATPERTVALKAIDRVAKLRKASNRSTLTPPRSRVAIVSENEGNAMTIRWPDKRPNESLNYSLDWSLRLGADTIASVAWTVPSPLVQEAVAVAGYVATIELSGGALNGKYDVLCRVTTTGGEIWEEVAKLWVRAR